MKLNWFSPVPPTRSSVAFDTAAVLPFLVKQAEVALWVHESVWAPELEDYAQVRHYDPANMPWADINAADATLYHIGNHPEVHAPIWQVNRQHPGIVVLHDVVLQHLFAGLANRNVLNRYEYREMMQFYHPEGGAELAGDFLSGARTEDEICERCPLTGAIFENALGIAVHTQTAYSLIKNLTTLPVAYVPLFPLPQEAGPKQHSSDKLPNDGVCRLIIFGFVSANRRLESIFNALRDFPQKKRFHLDIYGRLQNEESAADMITDFGLEGLVRLHGFVSDAELNSALSRSDLAINLRDPTMGEASASQLRIWQHALPSLVTDIGWYAEIPKDTVAIVRREAEIEDIQHHFANFLRNPETYRELGQNGRRYVQEHHTVDAYLRSLLALVEEVQARKASAAVFWMAGRSGRIIRPWFAESAAGVLAPRLAETISKLFDD